MKNSKLWTLVKKEWLNNPGITDEVLGQLVRALNAEVMPEHATAKILYDLVKQEYALVNNYTQRIEENRSTKAKNASQARWSNAKAMHEHTLSNANIGIGTDTGIEIGIGTGVDRDIEIYKSKLINSKY